MNDKINDNFELNDPNEPFVFIDNGEAHVFYPRERETWEFLVSKNCSCRGALLCVIKGGHLDAAACLIENKRITHIELCLKYIIKRDFFETFQQLCSFMTTKQKQLAFEMACSKARKHMIEYLFQRKVFSEMGLMAAIENKLPTSFIAFLLQTFTFKNIQEAFVRACFVSTLDIVQLLKEYGADITKGGLYESYRAGNEEVLFYLLENGAKRDFPLSKMGWIEDV